MIIRKIWQRLRHRQAFERDLDAELQAHLQLRCDDLIEQGMAADAALRQAKIELGMTETHKEQVRAMRGLAAVDSLTNYVKSALRTFRRYPTLCIGSALILGLTLAGNLALFAIDQTYRSAAPDVLSAGGVYELSLRNQNQSKAADLDDAELAQVRTALNEIADAVIIARPVRMMPSGGVINPSIAYGVAASGNYFQHLSKNQQPARARLGRTISAEDDQANAVPVIVLSDQGWRRLLPHQSNPVGQSIRFANTNFTVVGVMPAGFVDLQPVTAHFWISNAGYAQWRNAFAGSDKYFSNPLNLIGVRDLPATEHRLTNLLSQLPNRIDIDSKIASVSLLQRTSLLDASDAQDFRLIAIPVYLLVSLVLLVVCANLANLMLAKALAQQQELAIRASIGASRSRLIKQLFFDSSLIASLAAVIGIMLGALLVNPLHRYLLSILAEAGLQPLRVSIGPNVWLYGLLLCWVASLVFGLLPAISATRTQLLHASKRDALVGKGRLTPSRLRASLCVSQIACSFVLLVLALSISLLALQIRRADIGYETNGLIDLRHPNPDAQLRASIEQIPGVLGTTAIGNTPLYGWQSRAQAQLEQHSLSLGYNIVDERYLSTLGLKLLSGRNFNHAEADNQSPVALISAATARKFWPNANAIGKTIRLQQDDQSLREHTVVGIVSDVISGMLFAGTDSTALYVPGALAKPSKDLLIAVRPEQQTALRQQLLAVCNAHSAASPCDPWSFQYLRDRQQLIFVIAQNLCAMLALLALLITMIGLFAVVRFNLSHRKREIGVRLAIGATSNGVAATLLADHLRHVRWGLLLGLPIALLASYALHSVFSLTLTATVLGFIAALALIVCLGTIAAWLPTRAIGQISPTIALRDS